MAQLKGWTSDGGIIDFTANNNNNNVSFKIKQKITGKTGNDGTRHVERMIPLKYLNNFWRTLEMPINCKVNLILNGFVKCFIVAGTVTNQELTFAITDTKLCVTLLTQDNAKLLQQLKPGFKRTGINFD